MNTLTLRPHEALCEIIDRIEEIPHNVIEEIFSGDYGAASSPRGFACAAALQHLRGIILTIDKLDTKYDGSLLCLVNPSKVAAGEGLDLGDQCHTALDHTAVIDSDEDEDEDTENAENEEVEHTDEVKKNRFFLPFFKKPIFTGSRN